MAEPRGGAATARPVAGAEVSGRNSRERLEHLFEAVAGLASVRPPSHAAPREEPGDPVVVTRRRKGPDSIWTAGDLADTTPTECVKVNVTSDITILTWRSEGNTSLPRPPCPGPGLPGCPRQRHTDGPTPSDPAGTPHGCHGCGRQGGTEEAKETR